MLDFVFASVTSKALPWRSLARPLLASLGCLVLAGLPATRPAWQESKEAPTGTRSPEITLDELLAALVPSDDLTAQWETMQRFARQPDAPTAIPSLLAELRARAPQLDNNVGLTLELILLSHPAAPCPLDPLLEALRRPIWTSQQKCGQALRPLLERGDGRGREREIAGTLIPLLTSQRPRVFDVGRRCLEALTGQTLGDVPEPWLAWYAEHFGGSLDLTHAVYEDLIVVRPHGGNEGAPLRFELEGEEIGSLDVLRELLADRIAMARQRGLKLSVAIQIATERLKQDPNALLASEDVTSVMGLLEELGLLDMVVSPMSDGFRAPWRGMGASR